jgi:hypothetical protein
MCLPKTYCKRQCAEDINVLPPISYVDQYEIKLIAGDTILTYKN